ncbi:hypothetical protein BU17DRAFT_64220 [Hysterangium stoloniferum]|nr:hypothetical protein BU17DRAFT_64220 [Hysterangium stoloniferum]
MATVEVSKPVSAIATKSKDVDMPATESAAAEVEETAGGEGSTEAGDDVKEKVLTQIEFYFADSNLPYDRFMWTLHTANAEHWVPLATVSSFKRMRQFQDKGLPWIADVLRQGSDMLEVDESGTSVRRRKEVREPVGQFERSVYAKGFGEETPKLQGELENFFGKWGKVSAVRMRRMDQTKKFKGSAFCEYADMDSVTRFLEADPKPQWDGEDLLTMSKEAYCEMKVKEKGLTGKAADYRATHYTQRKGGFNAFAKDSTKEKGKKSNAEEKPEIFLEFLGVRLKINQDDGGSVEESEIPFVKGASLKFTGCGGDVSFSEIKVPLKERFQRPPYVKYQRGDDFGLLGFDKTLSDEDIAFIREQLEIVNDNVVEWEVPDEETEKAFQIERAKAAAQRVISNSDNRGSGGRGGGRGGRGARGGRGGRGGRGKRGGGRNREAKRDDAAEAGEKRKRAIEPDGGPDTKGKGVPVLQVAKKAKADSS